MNLIKGLVLGNLALFLYGLLQGWEQGTLLAWALRFSCAVLAIVAVAYLSEVGIHWKRRVWPAVPQLAPVVVDLPLPALEVMASDQPAVMVAAEPLVVRYKLTDTLHAMVRNHYDNRSIARSSMVPLNQTTQPYWNLANAILNGLGIRDPKQPSTWNGQGSSNADLKLLSTRVRIGEAAVEIYVDHEWVSVDLAGCHFL